MSEPRWLVAARAHLGVRETPGPKSTPVILKWAQTLGRKLGITYADDAVPWCGLFVAEVLDECQIALPPIPVRATSWMNWGQRLAWGVPGAILVFIRPGGGHVGFYVGEDAETYTVLGGNQGDAVSITRIAKARCTAIRWPFGEPVGKRAIPTTVAANAAPVSTNEA